MIELQGVNVNVEMKEMGGRKVSIEQTFFFKHHKDNDVEHEILRTKKDVLSAMKKNMDVTATIVGLDFDYNKHDIKRYCYKFGRLEHRVFDKVKREYPITYEEEFDKPLKGANALTKDILIHTSGLRDLYNIEREKSII